MWRFTGWSQIYDTKSWRGNFPYVAQTRCFLHPITAITARKTRVHSLCFYQFCASLFELQYTGSEEVNVAMWEIPGSHHLLPHQPEGDLCGYSRPWPPNKAKAVLEMETQLYKHIFPFQWTLCVATVSWMNFNFQLTPITWDKLELINITFIQFILLFNTKMWPFLSEKLCILKYSPWKVTAFLMDKIGSTIFMKAPASLK